MRLAWHIIIIIIIIIIVLFLFFIIISLPGLRAGGLLQSCARFSSLLKVIFVHLVNNGEYGMRFGGGVGTSEEHDFSGCNFYHFRLMF
jgi:hypothetical protein